VREPNKKPPKKPKREGALTVDLPFEAALRAALLTEPPRPEMSPSKKRPTPKK
jgi:hypothetical protein